MKLTGTIVLLLLITSTGLSQNQPDNEQNDLAGKFYFYWGWNRGWYSNSDISFEGTDYNLTLKNVVANICLLKFFYILP